MHYTDDGMFDVIQNISSMTHAHIYSIFSCIIYTVLINEYLKVFDIQKAYLNMQSIIKTILENNNNKIIENLKDLKNKFYRLIYNDISKLQEDNIKSSGYVIDSLEASIWCLLTTNNFQDAVLKAVNLGEDTDTIGALTGGLGGLVYGYNSIPKKWIDVLQRKEYLTDLVDKFNKLINEININESIYLWQTGLGDMNKYLKGENPLPNKSKKATIDSWKGCRKLTKYKKIECTLGTR